MATETVIVDFNFGQSFSRLATIKKQINDLNKDTKALAETTDTFGDVTEEAAQAIVINEASIRALGVEQRNLKKAVDDTTSSQDAATGSIVANRAELSRLKAEYIKLAKPTQEQAKRIKELNDRLKEQEKDIGVTSRNVGNYSESITDAAQKSGLFSRELNVLKSIQGSLSALIPKTTTATKAQTVATTAGAKATTIATGALKLFKIALASTGIGLLIIALGSLITFLTQSQRGMDKVRVAIDAISTAVKVVVDRIILFGEGLALIASGEVSKGLDQISESFKGIGEEIKEETKESIELTKASQDLRDAEIELIEVNAERKNQIAELRIEARKETNDLETRKKALQGAIDLEQQILEDELKIASERARISQERLDQGETTADEQRENAEVQADLFRLEETTRKRLLTLTAEQATLINKTASEQAKGTSDVIAQEKLLAELREQFLTDEQISIDTIIERAQAFRDAGGEEIDIQRFIAQEFASLEEEKSSKLLEELQKRTQALGQSAATEILLLQSKFNQEILAAQGNSEEIIRIEEEKNQAVLEKTRELLEGQLQILQAQFEQLTADAEGGLLLDSILSDEGVATLENNIAQLLVGLDEVDIKLQEITTDAETGEPFNLLEKIGIDEDKFEFGIDIAQQGLASLGELFASLSRNRIQALEEEKDKALKGAEGNAKAQEKIETDFNKKIEAEKRKAFEQQKKIQIAQATIQTLTGIITAVNTGMQAGFPAGPILAAVLAAFVAATGAIQIAGIKSQTFEKGGVVDVGGKDHSQGGTNYVGEDGNSFNVQRGERMYVLNRGASQAIRGLSDLNMAHGGRSFFSGPTSFGQTGGEIAAADGGFSTRQLASSIEDRLGLTEALAEAISDIPLEVSVVEIERVTEERNNSVDVSELSSS